MIISEMVMIYEDLQNILLLCQTISVERLLIK